MQPTPYLIVIMDHAMNNGSNCPDVVVGFLSLPYELKADFNAHMQWLRSIHVYAIATIPVYLFGIYAGQKIMQSRDAVNLKWQLFTWNLMLAVFSLIGAARVVHDFCHVLTRYDVYASVCILGPCNVRGFWMSAFALSKVVELGDTVFLILRKRPVIFLHWYHHVSVLLFTWTSSAEAASFGRYFMGINFIIHFFMYSYYAVQSLGIRLGKAISMTITTLQIAQMLAGIFVVAYANRMIRQGTYCEVKEKTITIALVMYASYFILFVRFFYKAYISSGGSEKRRTLAAAISTLDPNQNHALNKNNKKGL